MSKTNSKANSMPGIPDSLFNKIVAVITALSLIFLQVPISSLTSAQRAQAANNVSASAAPEATIDIPLSFEHAYIIYDKQTIAEPATKVSVPAKAAFQFEAVADSGYQLESVKATIDDVETTLKAKDGKYKLTADEVATVEKLVLRAITAPTVEESAVEVATTTKIEASEAFEPAVESEPAVEASAASKAADEIADSTPAAQATQASETAEATASSEGAAEEESAPTAQATEPVADEAVEAIEPAAEETVEPAAEQAEELEASESVDADEREAPAPEAETTMEVDSTTLSELAASESDESVEQATIATSMRTARKAAVHAAATTSVTTAVAASGSTTALDSSNAEIEFGIYRSSTDRANRTNPIADDTEIAMSDMLYGLIHYDFKTGEGPTTGRLTYTYTLPSNIHVVDKAKTALYDDNFNVAGSWEIINGVVYFYYDEAWAKKHPDGGGYFSFDFQLDETKTETGKDTSFNFPGASTTVTVKVAQGDLTGSKNNSGIDANGYVTYTVNLHAEQAFNYFQFTDKLDSALTYVDGSFTIDGNAMSVSTSKSSDGSTTAAASASSISKGDHVITYRAKVDETTFAKLSNWGSIGAGNVATWMFGDSADNPKSHYDTSYVWAQKNIINKASSGVTSDGTASWTVTVNGSSTLKTDISGYTFTDTLGSGHKYTGSYQVIDASGNVIATGAVNKNSTSFSYTFPSNAGANTYYIKYSTVLDDTSKENTVDNTATLTPPGGTPTTSKTGVTYYPSTSTSGGSTDPGSGTSTTAQKNIDVTKEVLDYSQATTTGEVSWHSTITVNNWPSSNAGTLEFYDDTWNYGNNQDWNNRVGYATLWHTGAPELSAGGIALVEGVDYEVVDAAGNVIGMTPTQKNYAGDTVDEGLRIRFNTDSDTMKGIIANHMPIDVYYSTMCDGTHAEYVNTAYIYRLMGTWAADKQSADARYKIEGNPGVIKKSNSMSLDMERGKWVAEWEVDVNYLNNNVIGDLKSPTVRVIDELPEGMTYIAGSASSWFVRTGSQGYWSTTDSECPAYAPAITQNGTTLTFEYDFTTEYPYGWNHQESLATQLSDGSWTNNTFIVLKFKTELASENVVRDGTTQTLYNTASADAGGVDLGSGHAQATYTDSVIKKEGYQDGENPVVHYTITVNESGQKLDPEDSHTAITLNDTLDTRSTVLLSSIKVTNLRTGEDITESCPVSYDAEAADENGNPTTAFSVRVPDSTPVTVEYNVLLSGTVGEQVDVSNSASLNGISSKETKTESRYEVRQSDAGVYGSATKILITKYDADDVVNKKLSGAEFTLYRVDMSKLPSGTFTDAQLAAASTTIYVGTTDEDGSVYLGEPDGSELALSTDTLYYFKETKAPAGYGLDSTARFVMVQGNDYNNQLAIAKSHGVTPSQTVIYNAIDKELDEPTTIEVSGIKTWNDQNNHDGLRPATITVNLLANGEKVAEQTVSADASGNWSYTFSDLPQSDANGEIAYAVTEDAVAGYTATVSGYDIVNKHDNETIGISGAKVWNDGDDQDGIRPDSVTVNLLANGKGTGKTTTATAKGGWTFAFDKLDKYDSNGKAIIYTVEESEVNGYTSVVTGSMSGGFTITNTHKPETVEIPVKKVWNDADNQDGKRKAEVTAKLMVDGVEVAGVARVKLNEANNWSGKFTDLPKYKDGVEIAYTVDEGTTVAPDYAKSVGGDLQRGFTITNTHMPETTSVSGMKSWNDYDDNFGDRPASVTIHLLADGKEVATTTATAAGNWAYSFDDLPVYMAGAVGQAITYTVAESDLTDYLATVVQGGLLNTFNPELTSVTVKKAWNDGDDEDGVRPDSVKVHLLINGMNYLEADLTAANGWTYTWSNLAKRYQGADAVYTVVEDAVAGYDSSEVTGNQTTGYTITNTRTVTPSTSLTIRKSSTTNEWATLAGAKFVLTPVSPAGEARSAFTGSDGTVTFDKLKQGATYTLQETVAPGGYQLDDTVYHLSVSNDNNLTLTCAEEGLQISGNAAGGYWAGVYDQPDSGYGKIILHKDVTGAAGAQSQNLTVRSNIKLRVENIETGAYVEFTGIGRATKAYRTNLLDRNGQAIGQVTIRPTEAFTSQVENLPSGTWKVTELADGLTDFSGANAAKTGVGDTFVRTTTYSIDGDTTKLIGTSSTNPATLVIDNTYYDKGSLVLTKEFGWDYTNIPASYAGNQLGEDATQKILKNIDFTLTGQNTGEVYEIKGNYWNGSVKTTVASKSGNTAITVAYYNKQWTITNLPLDTYTVVEQSDGYNDEGSEPDTILHKFYTTGSFTVTSDAATTNVNVADSTGTRGDGTVSETEASVSVGGEGATMNVLNVYYRPKAVEATKTWNIPEGIDYTPGDIEVQLVRSINGIDNEGKAQQGYYYPVKSEDVPEHPGYVTKKTLHWNSETKSYDKVYFPNLPAVTANGEQITYEVREVRPDGTLVEMVNGSYTDKNGTVLEAGNTYIDANGVTAAAGWGDGWKIKKNPYTEPDGTQQYYSSTKGLTIVNTMESTEVSGKKTWDDVDNQDGKRPSSVTVRLFADGADTGKTATATAESGWAYRFTNLPKYQNGVEIAYTVTEDAVEGYTTEINGTNITNKHNPEKTKVSGSKTWSDAGDQDGKRPKSITVRLWKGDEEVASKTVKAGDDGKWSYEFTGLDKYENGAEIAYRVTEDAVPGYTTAIDGTKITNAHTPEKTSVSGQKVWDDANDQDGIRPASVTVHLFANGADTGKTATATVESNWAYSFADLDKYVNGTEITYTVTEDAVAGYDETTIEGYTITNARETEKTRVSGVKVWRDGDDQDGIRPATITVRLLANGIEVASKAVAAGNDGSWSYEFANLDKYANGEEIVYAVTEDAVPGYTTGIIGTTITNTHVPETTSVAGAKVWKDANDQDGLRPTSITVRLLADGVEADTRVLAPDAEGNWPGYSFYDLPVYKNGSKIAYTVTEDAVAGYTTTQTDFPSGSGAIFTNTHVPEKTSVSGAKTWNDEGNQDGKRPASITVRLLADDADTGKTATATEATGWSYEFTGLDKYAEGKEIVYTVDEDDVAGYDKSIDGYDITNTHTPESTEVKVVKAWNDGNDHDGLRPDAITVQLLADGDESGEAVTLNDDNDWECTWAGLDKYAAGKEIVYTVAEAASGNSTAYTTSEPAWDAEKGVFVITNTHEVVPVTVKGTKTWSDNGDQDGVRPASITVNLLANGEVVKSETVMPDAEGNWSFEFANLDRYKDGKPIAYTVSEDEVAKYTATITGDAENGFTIDNAYSPEKTQVSVAKEWNDASDRDGIRPSALKVRLLANGAQVAVDGEVELNDANGWAYTWTDLDRYADGVEIKYTVEEDTVSDYSAELSGSATAGYKLVNTHAPTLVDVHADKAWNDADDQDGKRAGSIEVRLVATVDGAPVAIDGVEMTAKLSASNSWHHEWNNLPQKRNGKTIAYALAEVGATEGYTTAVTSSQTAATATANATTTFTVVNEHAPELIDIPASKDWNDADDQDGKRPDSITVQLFADGEPVLVSGAPVTAELNAGNGWAVTFSSLPKYANGAEIAYRVAEVAVPAEYEASADGVKGNGYVLANDHETEKLSVSVKKVWDDADNQDGKRGNYVSVELTANGEVVKTATLNAENGWAVAWSDLPKYVAGAEIDYELSEASASVPEGYTASVSKAASETSISFTATNAHTPETVDVSGSKTWSDANDQDGVRPTAITVNLLANGSKIDSAVVTPNASGDWNYSFTGLPKYAAGEEISYSVSEETVEGYTLARDGYDLENSYKPGETNVSVAKVWSDADNQDGVRPSSVKVQLFADGVERGDAVTLSEGNSWAYTWEGLPQRAAGKGIAYTVGEVAGDWSPSYASVTTGTAADGYTITNTHKPDETSASVVKAWNDADNQDGKRAESIEVQLLADGVAYGAPVTLSEGNDWEFTWSNLPKRTAGTEVAYTLDEVSSVAGYATSVAADGFSFTVANSHDVELIDIPVSKEWVDAGNQDGIRPPAVTVRLMNGADQVATLELNAANNWSGTFSDLPKYQNGHEVTYALEEVAVEGYESAIEGDRTTGFTVTNTHTPEVTTARVTKVWDDADNQDGKRASEVVVQLLANDGAYGEPITLSAANGWSYQWENLPKFAAEGVEIAYGVTESAVPDDYTAAVTGDLESGFVVTNSYTPGVRNVTVSKAWDDAGDQDGVRPANAKVRLLADGSPIAVEGVATEVELSAGNSWTYTWENLDQMKAGRDIAYTVEEVDVPEGYRATTAGSVDEGFVITNAHAPETTEVEASKVWSDDDDRDGVRPAGVLITLYGNGEEVSSQNVTADARGNWSFTFTNLPKNAHGTEIVYTIGEEVVSSYEGSIDGFTATNTHENEKVDVSGQKTWIDADNVKGLRPSEITVNLFADGEKVDSQTATAESGWAYRFTGLNKYRDGGIPIAYTVTEDAVENYDTWVDGYDVTNMLIPTEDVEFFAMKTLNGRTLSADEFTFELLEDGRVLQSVTNAGDGHARFEPITYTMDSLGAHNYTIREVAGTAAGVTYDTTSHDFTVLVTNNGDGTLSVAYDGYDPAAGVAFENTYVPSGSVDLQVYKQLDGEAPAAGAYTFQLADAQGNVYATATNAADGTVTFPTLNFKAAGTYAYVITEVVPDDAQLLAGKPVSGNVIYDTREVNVTIEAIDNFDGTLRFKTEYDRAGVTFENASAPEVAFPLEATKAIEGRDFAAGDSFTFTVSADGGAPMPARPTATIAPSSGASANVSFGDITFTAADLGQTYTYTISEQGAGETERGLANDPFAHWVKLTVIDAGDGSLGVLAEYENDADGITFTNRYAAAGEAQLTATKVLTGRALAEGEFFFELSGDGLPAPLHASAAADGSVAFPAIAYTQADAGSEFHYTIREVQGTLGGVTYDTATHDVTVRVADNGDGTLAVTYDYGDAVGAPVFTNDYRAEGTSVELAVHKALVGGKLSGGDFSFTLSGTSANARGTQQAVTNAADGTVAFDALTFDEAGTYEYMVAEVIPADATDNGDGTFTGADGIIYDGAQHTAVVTVTDDGYGKLVAEVAYDGGEAPGISFGNVALTRTGFTFNKYYYGGVGSFDFKLTAVDASGVARSGEAVDYSSSETIVDDGAQAFTATVQNGAFADGVARVVFPEISYSADGDYYYLVEELDAEVAGVTSDAAQYLVHVVVTGGSVASTAYELIYNGTNYGATDDLAFYNNSTVKLGLKSLATAGYAPLAERVSVYPKAKKYLNGATDLLASGEFTFELIDDATGAVLATATNDEEGEIAFFDENVDPGLVYDEAGTYRYTMREIAGNEAGITYDTSAIALTVEVAEGSDGLSATTTYNGPGGGEAAFYNVKRGMDVTVQKVSREGGEGLAGSVYALWMVGEGGDVLVQEATSDASGYITFTDVSLTAGAKYYFKEVAAPSGHTVDPYRTAYFTLNADGTGLVLAEKTASDGWHPATETTRK